MIFNLPVFFKWVINCNMTTLFLASLNDIGRLYRIQRNHCTDSWQHNGSKTAWYRHWSPIPHNDGGLIHWKPSKHNFFAKLPSSNTWCQYNIIFKLYIKVCHKSITTDAFGSQPDKLLALNKETNWGQQSLHMSETSEYLLINNQALTTHQICFAYWNSIIYGFATDQIPSQEQKSTPLSNIVWCALPCGSLVKATTTCQCIIQKIMWIWIYMFGYLTTARCPVL